MREIKFRMWDTKQKGWVMPPNHQSSSEMLISEAFDTVGMHPKILRLGESTGRYALMQYTGLKDKNGVEIYEGDVICMRYPNSYCSKYGHADEVVIYEDGHYPVFFSDGGETFDDPSKLTEVIGNIYENPELLK